MAEATLTDYIERARTLFEEKGGRLPDAEALRLLAVAVGMSEQESEQADQLARELTEQARGDLEQGRHEQAAEALLKAVLYSPVRLEPHHTLAQIHYGRWRKSGTSANRLLAIDLCQRALELAPNHEPSTIMLRDLGVGADEGLSWRRAGLIVIVLVSFSLAMTTCVRCIIAPPQAPIGADELDASSPTLGLPRAESP
ncbi:MAG: hypothetical protein H0U74_07985 [Bradymonadaceae bacterium]|nr:hypothetical protein [Lujinxingiaceae bacterium]